MIDSPYGIQYVSPRMSQNAAVSEKDFFFNEELSPIQLRVIVVSVERVQGEFRRCSLMLP